MLRPIIALLILAALGVAFWLGADQRGKGGAGNPVLSSRAEVPPLASMSEAEAVPAPIEPSSPGAGDEEGESQPDLVLLATTVSPSVLERSRAHVLDRTSRARYVLAQDQEVAGYEDLRLVEIDDGRVVFDFAGQRLELFMDTELAWPEDPSSRPAPVKLTELLSLMKPIELGESEEEFMRRYEYGLGKLYRMDLGLRTDDALFKQGVFAPKREDGRQVGFYASRISKGSFWDTLGVEAGDVIVEVNGIPVEGPESNRDAAREVISVETKIQLMIRRDGELFETSTQSLPVNTGIWADETAFEVEEG